MDPQQNPFQPKAFNMVFTCSGAADVGNISDQAARQLSKERVAGMSCSIAVAAGIPEILDSAIRADKIVAIDGCPKNCTKTVLNNIGFDDIVHFNLVDDLGMSKGESAPTEERVEKVVEHAKISLGDIP